MRPAFLPLTVLFLAHSAGAQSPFTYKGWEMKLGATTTAPSVGMGTIRQREAGPNEKIVVLHFEAKRLDPAESIFVKDFRLTDDSGKQYSTDLLETFLYKGKKHHAADLPFTVPKNAKPAELRLLACPNSNNKAAPTPECQEVTFQLKKTP